METIHIVIGPTASGKTAYSVELAQQINGEVINADAFQFYRGMDVGVAKIKPEEMQGVAHHLFDILDPDEEMDIAKFQKMCRDKITEVTSRGKMPILVGGSGLYINCVIFDYNLASDVDYKYRDLLSTLSAQQKYDILRILDPEYADITDVNNEKRVVRALEYFHTNHKKFSDCKGDKTLVYNVVPHHINISQDELKRRIHNRVEEMISEGLLQEVEELRNQGITIKDKSQAGIGYKEVHAYFDDKNQDIEELKHIIETNTLKLAKRQKTWFRNKTLPYLGEENE